MASHIECGYFNVCFHSFGEVFFGPRVPQVKVVRVLCLWGWLLGEFGLSAWLGPWGTFVPCPWWVGFSGFGVPLLYSPSLSLGSGPVVGDSLVSAIALHHLLTTIDGGGNLVWVTMVGYVITFCCPLLYGLSIL